MHILPIVLAVIGGVWGLGVYYREVPAVMDNILAPIWDWCDATPMRSFFLGGPVTLTVLAVILAFCGLCINVPAAVGYWLGELLLAIF